MKFKKFHHGKNECLRDQTLLIARAKQGERKIVWLCPTLTNPSTGCLALLEHWMYCITGNAYLHPVLGLVRVKT